MTKKFDFAMFKQKLKDGEYGSLAGANRAIGKSRDLTAEEKEKAKTLAAKQFGVKQQTAQEIKPKGKVGRPTGSKKTPQAGKKAKAVEVVPEADKSPDAMPAQPGSALNPTFDDKVRVIHMVVTTANVALASLELSAKMDSSCDITRGVRSSTSVLNKVMGSLDKITEEASTYEEATIHSPPKEGKRVKAEPPSVQEEEETPKISSLDLDD